MSENILALDLSLTETGYAYRMGPEHGFGTIGSKLRGTERLDEITDAIHALATDCDLVVIEGPALHAQGRGVCDRWALRGCVLLDLWRAGIPTVEVPPTLIKKYATTKGNANKDSVLSHAIRLLGYLGSNNNEADAWVMLHMAETYIDGAERPAYRSEAIAKVVWPL